MPVVESMRINAMLCHFAISGNVLCVCHDVILQNDIAGPSNVGCRWHNLRLIIFLSSWGVDKTTVGRSTKLLATLTQPLQVWGGYFSVPQKVFNHP